jgi:RND superfamily putative drug exporter
VGTAGTAVVFAGSTVVIALVALVVTGVPFMQAMGFTAAGTVVLAVLIATTLVPALLGFAGPRALHGKSAERADEPPTMGLRWVSLVVCHRLAAISLGDRAWWLPRSLDRLIPNVDIEGARLPSEPQPVPARALPQPA